MPVSHISRNLAALQQQVDLVLGIGRNRLAPKQESCECKHDRLPDWSIFHGKSQLRGYPDYR